MIVGYRPGRGLLHRAHPFTVLALAGSAGVLAFALPSAEGAVALAAALALIAVIGRVPSVLWTTLVFGLPFWVFLVLLHGVLGDDPARVVAVGAPVTALLIAFLLVLVAVEPARLVDALVARRVPFAAAYLLAATLQAVPRLRDRARAILDAQRCRGLRVRGSPWRRVRALVPLALPLVLGALAEADDRALALEARGGTAGARRTPLHPPADSRLDRLVRWMLALAAAAALVLRVVR